MFKIDNDSTWGLDMDMVMGWEEFSREFIWNSTFELSSIAELSDATQLSLKLNYMLHCNHGGIVAVTVMLKSSIFWKVSRIYFQTMILTVSLIIDIKPWAYTIETQARNKSRKLPLQPAGPVTAGLPARQSGRPIAMRQAPAVTGVACGSYCGLVCR